MFISTCEPNQIKSNKSSPGICYTRALCRRRRELLLVRDQQPRDRGAGEGAEGAREHGADCDARDVAGAAGRQLGEHTDLVSEGADVGEPAERVGGDQLGSGGEVLVFGAVLEGVIGDELVLEDKGLVLRRVGERLYGGGTYHDEFHAEELADL